MEYSRRDKGKIGEDIAAQYLKKRGYKIIERNYCFGRKGEIDIIAKDPDNGFTVFIEVKTKDSLEFGYPESAITKNKIEQVRKVADYYLYEKNITEIDCRFDVITILKIDGGEPDLNHYKDAF
jgi:putative endonuclease